MKKVILALIVAISLLGCTQNARTRTFGGEEFILLKPNEVLITATWKNTDLWILTKDTTTGICYFRENSSFGIWEGQITFSNTYVK